MLQDFFIYLRERFPIIPAIVFSVLFAFAAVTYGNDGAVSLATPIIPALTLFLFFLRLRLWDEKKDYTYDSEYHSERPVQRGLIPLATLFRCSIVILFFEIFLQLVYPAKISFIFLLIAGYSWLMYKEFFMSRFLKKHILIYSASHQLIFLFYVIYFLSIGQGSFFFPSTTQDWALATALFLLPYIYEIGRKCRHRFSSKGERTDDTYVYQWGEHRAFAFLILLFVGEAIALFHFLGSSGFFIGYLTALVSAVIAFFFVRSATLYWAPAWSMFLGIYGLILLDLSLI